MDGDAGDGSERERGRKRGREKERGEGIKERRKERRSGRKERDRKGRRWERGGGEKERRDQRKEGREKSGSMESERGGGGEKGEGVGDKGKEWEESHPLYPPLYMAKSINLSFVLLSLQPLSNILDLLQSHSSLISLIRYVFRF